MKKVFLSFSVLLLPAIAKSQNVGINTTAATPNPSAMLDVDATNRGLLIPRVALTATNSALPVTSPATSLLVYNTATAGAFPNNVTPGYYYWDGSQWLRLLNGVGSGTAWLTTGNAASGSDFIGTTNLADWIVRTNNTERMRLTSIGNLGIGTLTPIDRLSVYQGNIRIIRDDGHRPVFWGETYNNFPFEAPHFVGLRGRGTQSAPSFPLANDALAAFQGRPYTNTSWSGMSVWAAENQTAAAQGTFLLFYTVPIGSIVNHERMRILANGNVGVGTTTPIDRLSVYQGDIRTTRDDGIAPVFRGEAYNSNPGFPAHFIGLRGRGTQSAPSFPLADDALASFQGRPYTDISWSGMGVYAAENQTVAAQGSYLTFHTVSIGSMVTQERMRILANGNVGIGIINPAVKLDVVGTGSGTTDFRVNGRIQTGDAGGNGGIWLSNAANMFVGQNGTNAGFWTLTAGWNAFQITQAGNVGIGTTTPPTKLVVWGPHPGAGLGTGVSNDAPSQAIIPSGHDGISRFNDWPSGWGGGLSTWDVCGSLTYFSNYITRSDSRYKKDIVLLKENKDVFIKDFMSIQPVSYFLNPETLPSNETELKRKRFGFIANDIEKLFPNLVINAGMPDSIYRGIEYDGFIPMLVLVVQQQNEKLEKLEAENNNLKTQVQNLKSDYDSRLKALEQTLGTKTEK